MLIVVILDIILSNAVHADCSIFTVKPNAIIPSVLKQSVVVPSVLAPFSAGYEKNISEISSEDYIIKLLRPISIPYHNKLDRLSLNQFNPGLIVADKAGAYSS
jgi:hypothetical protein